MNHSKIVAGSIKLMALIGLAGILSGCRGLSAGSSTPTPTPTPAGIESINHIVLLVQENRGFDHYFGTMRQYWASHGFPDHKFDGLANFNPSSGIAPLRGDIPTNPGCDPAFPFPANDCTHTLNSPLIESFHLLSMCIENPSPSWNESHVDWNLNGPLSATPTLDGFVMTAAHDARTTVPLFSDTDGRRAMSYYNGDDLPYYYFMASTFGTSDSWFSPVMTRTQANRMYMLGATSAGHVYALAPTEAPLSNPTIFDLLQSKGITWKVYVTDLDPTYAAVPIQDSALNAFATAGKYPQNIVPVSQYFTDLTNGTLPAVAYIDAGLNSGLDEHPGLDDNAPGGSVQAGANYVSSLVGALMQSTSWKDSVFILTYDEGGGFYDHIAPQTGSVFPNPDGIAPRDLLQGPPPNGPDLCVMNTGPNCDFTYSGYRVPLIVISPFSKKNFVSHTVADYTAWLRLVEKRFGLDPLTKRDAAQMDMTEFFDFVNVPWKTPPAQIPVQPTNGSCYLDHLP